MLDLVAMFSWLKHGKLENKASVYFREGGVLQSQNLRIAMNKYPPPTCPESNQNVETFIPISNAPQHKLCGYT